MSESINGYTLTCDWKVSGTAQWAYAEKDGRQWFVKRFLSPKYKIVGKGASAEAAEKAYKRCEMFRKKQEAYYAQISRSDTGNVVCVTDFFSFGTEFYAVSPRIEIANISLMDVSRLSHEKKLVLLKVLTYSLEKLHSNGVVHADLKPTNVILKKTKMGSYTLKLIDFEAGFLLEDPRRGRDIVYDQNYVAPETLVATENPEITLDGKIDVFALGLLFYQYYTGKDPVLTGGCSMPGEALLCEQEIRLDAPLPGWLRELIQQMLQLEPGARPTVAEVFQCLREERMPRKISIPEDKDSSEIGFKPIRFL